jgi:hypothetical protein
VVWNWVKYEWTGEDWMSGKIIYIYGKAKVKIIYPTYEAFHTLIGFDFDFDDMKM